MKKSRLIIGFILVIIGGIFLNALFISLLAMPLFLGGFILLFLHYQGLLDKEKANARLYRIVLGAGFLFSFIGLSMMVIVYSGYISELESSEFMNRNVPGTGQLVDIPAGEFIMYGASMLVSTGIIFFSLLKGGRISDELALVYSLALLLLMPVIIFLFWIIANQGFPVLG